MPLLCRIDNTAKIKAFSTWKAKKRCLFQTNLKIIVIIIYKRIWLRLSFTFQPRSYLLVLVMRSFYTEATKQLNVRGTDDDEILHQHLKEEEYNSITTKRSQI